MVDLGVRLLDIVKQKDQILQYNRTFTCYKWQYTSTFNMIRIAVKADVLWTCPRALSYYGLVNSLTETQRTFGVISKP